MPPAITENIQKLFEVVEWRDNQRLRTIAVLAKKPGWVLSTHLEDSQLPIIRTVQHSFWEAHDCLYFQLQRI